jgi:hypothetical protein
MKSLSVKLGVILIGLLILGNAEVWGADWKLYVTNELYWAYYDAQSITRPSKNIVRVWTKNNFTEKGVLNWVGDLGKKYENLSYTKVLMEINCVENKLRRLSGSCYDNKGDVISPSSFPSEWDFIPPETIAESLYKAVCK